MSETTTTNPTNPAAQETPPAEDTTPKPDTVQRDAAKPLGEPGLKALQAERDRADRLESEIKKLQRSHQQQFEALRSVFGDDTDASAKPEDVVRTLQEQVAQLRHENDVNAAARQYGITDQNDLDLLRAAGNPDLLRQWAERLKPSTTTQPATPEPDPGQGARPGTPASEDDAVYRQFFTDPSR